MELALATHFSHGGSYGKGALSKLLKLIHDASVDGIRDGLTWSQVEESRGSYDFSDFRTSYFDLIEAAGLNTTITLLPHGNRLYDSGKTVTTDKGVDAFADYVVAVLTEFPSIDRIAIGNEFNGLNDTFVTGKAMTKNIGDRVEIYTKILKAVHDKVEDAGLDVDISGGALHSVATGYVQEMIKQGTFAYMDSLDIHPYGLDPTEVGEAFERLNEILDTLPAKDRPEIVVSEFGSSAEKGDPLSNASYFAKMAVVLADAGVSMASWYALLDEDDSGTPDMGLYDTPNRANDMLDGFKFMADLLQDGAQPKQIDAGPGIELYQINANTYMLWGSAQSLDITGKNLVFRDAAGHKIDEPDRLGDDPIYVEGRQIKIAGEDGDGALLGDSFYDFELDPDPDGPWSYLGLKTKNDKEFYFDLEVFEGQTRMDEVWNPYLGNTYSRPFFLTADTFLPVAFGTTNKIERTAVERFTVEADGKIDIVGSWSVDDASRDGVTVEVELNGKTVAMHKVTSDLVLAVRALEVEKGDQVDFIVHSDKNATGDLTTRHIRILETDASVSDAALIAEHRDNDIIDDNGKAKTAVFGSAGTVADKPSRDDADSTTPPADVVTLTGSGKRDKIYADDVDTLIYGYGGNDKLYGGDGDDTLYGGEGRDKLYGGDGDDTIYGGGGRDKLFGGKGNDFLIGGEMKDRLRGDDGADTFVLTNKAAMDIILDFDEREGDMLDLTGFNITHDHLEFVERKKYVDLWVHEGGESHRVARLLGDDSWTHDMQDHILV